MKARFVTGNKDGDKTDMELAESLEASAHRLVLRIDGALHQVTDPEMLPLLQEARDIMADARTRLGMAARNF